MKILNNSQALIQGFLNYSGKPESFEDNFKKLLINFFSTYSSLGILQEKLSDSVWAYNSLPGIPLSVPLEIRQVIVP